MTPKEVVQAWCETQQGNTRAVSEKYFADDIKVFLPGSNPIVGKEKAIAHFESVGNAFKDESFDPADEKYVVQIAEGNMVARRFRWHCETKDGQRMDFFCFNLFVVENEKIVRFEEHFDTLARSRYTYGYEPANYREGFDPTTWLM